MANPNDTTVDDLLAGLVADQLAGRTPDLQALLDANPQQAEEIKSRYQDLERLSVLWREGPVAAVQQGFSAGALVGEYEIDREIGRGGMGVVYLARQKDLDRQVALKVIPPTSLSAITRQRFLREAKALASLSHPNIVPVFTAGEQAGSLFIAMEYVPGVPLSTLIRAVRNRPAGQKASQAWAECLASGKAPEDSESPDRTRETAALDSQYLHTCLSIAGQIASALTQAHDGGVIHRDIKPANIIISSDGRARLLDFGLAAVHTEPHVTVSGEFFGTPHYVSPEQAAGKSALVGPASDQYSLGAMLYECLALRPPFDGDSISVVLSNVLNEDPRGVRQVNPTLPRDIETILAKTLSKCPQDRYDSMTDLAEDIERFATGRPILAKRANWPQRLVKWARRRPAVATLLVLIVAMLIGGAALWSWQERQKRLAEQTVSQTEVKAKKERAERIIQTATAEQWQYARLMVEADRQWRAGDPTEAKRLLAETPKQWRHWEWNLLKWKCNPEKLLLPRQDRASFLSWSPNGEALAVLSHGNVQIWDLATGKLSWKRRSSHSYRPGGVAWLEGGKRVLTCGNGNVHIWDAANGKHLKAFSVAPPEAKKTGRAVQELAVSPDERQIIIVGGKFRDSGWVGLHDLATGKLSKTYVGHSSSINAVAFSPDGKGFATAGEDGIAMLWDFAKDQPIAQIRGHGAGSASVFDVIFTPDGKRLVTTGRDGMVHLWDPKTSKLVRSFKSTGANIRTISISPDGSKLAGISVDGLAPLWDIATGKIITQFRGHGTMSQCVDFSPDGKSLATGDQLGIRIWDLQTRPEDVQFGRLSASPTFTCDGTKIVSLGGRNEGLRILSADDKTVLYDVKELGSLVSHVASHPTDANLLATLNIHGGLDLWNLADNRAEWTILGNNVVRRGPAFSPDGRVLAVSTWEASSPEPRSGAVSLYDTGSGKLLKTLTFPHRAYIISISFSPDGLYVAAINQYRHPKDNKVLPGVTLWRLSDGKYIRTISGQGDGLYTFAFSPNSKLIATGHNNHVIRLLDVKTDEVRVVMHGHKSRVVALAFSPDGRRIVSVGRKVIIWDPFTAQPVTTLLNNEGERNPEFHSVAFSPDGRSIAVGGYKRQMRIWSIPQNRPTNRQPTSRPAGAH
ncbi:MAG: protein kinase [Phycisphaerae bacterium]|nr:protein kinase [Phycisphaerae bacterium]